jgi:hypothetical protein
MARYVKVGPNLIDLDSVTSASFGPRQSRDGARLSLAVGGHVMTFDGAAAENLWEYLLRALSPFIVKDSAEENAKLGHAEDQG